MCIWAAARPQQAINEQAMAYPTDVTRQVVAAKNVIWHLISSTSSLWYHLIIWYHPIAILLILRFQAMKLVVASTSNVKILDAFTLYRYLRSILVQKLKSYSLLHMLGQWTLPVLQSSGPRPKCTVYFCFQVRRGSVGFSSAHTWASVYISLILLLPLGYQVFQICKHFKQIVCIYFPKAVGQFLQDTVHRVTLCYLASHITASLVDERQSGYLENFSLTTRQLLSVRFQHAWLRRYRVPSCLKLLFCCCSRDLTDI